MFMSISIQPLSNKTLPEAITLAQRVFFYEPAEWFAEPITNSLHFIPKIYKGVQCTGLKYWVALDGERTIGIIGLLTTEPDETEAAWISWFGVDSDYRGQGIGKKLLELVISEAKKTGKQWLRLYSSDDPNEAIAQQLYNKYGFVLFEPPWRVDELVFYKQLNLSAV